MKKLGLFCALAISFLVLGDVALAEVSFTNSYDRTSTVSPQQKADEELPRMTLSEALRKGVKEVIITEIDIPEAAELLETLPMMMPRSSGGKWVYMYTAEPYALYRHSKTMEWKMVQVTPTWQHVQNTVVNGWMSSMAGSYNYANSFARG
ncbi:hypothetical protein RYR35_001998 [Streptococcus iniae]|nr:hypothetical protein [Streptococcus iniae]